MGEPNPKDSVFGFVIFIVFFVLLAVLHRFGFIN
jgi:hypothetical protein